MSLQRVSVQQTTLPLLTYGWGRAYDEAPFIRRFCPRSQPIYPYTSLEKLSDDPPQMKSYAAVVLENDFLRLTFLPGLNGRLYSAFDKVNGVECLYANPEMKPGLFGLRGAWCIGGIEYNFPNSHTTTTLEPIGGFVREHEDGSASFVCGNVEWVSRMSWSMEVRLRPDRAAIEMTSQLYNGTDFPHRFYYWVNAGVPVYEQSQFIYPASTHRVCTHPPMDPTRLAHLDWPIHDGQDLSRFRNIHQHLPIFAAHVEEDFFGIFHHHMNHGLVHVADHTLVPGRKIWTFGNARDGRIWTNLLTDTSVDYAELQSGPMPLQSDYALLAPGAVHVQREAWYPVSGTGGFNAASESAAAHVEVEAGAVRVRACANRRVDDAVLSCRLRDGRTVTARVRLDPLRAAGAALALPSGAAADGMVVTCRDAQGDDVFAYHHHPDPAARRDLEPVRAPQPLPDSEGYLHGLHAEKQADLRTALARYREAEGRDLRARAALARLFAARGLLGKATQTSDAVLAVERENRDALYVRALCRLQAGDRSAAEEALAVLMRTAPRDALRLLSRAAVRSGDYRRALALLRDARPVHGDAPHQAALRAYCARKLGRLAEARRALQDAVEQFAFEPLARGEALFLECLDPLGAPDDQQSIEIACRYMALGDDADALAVLDRHCVGREGDALAMVHYYRAWLAERLGLARRVPKLLAAAEQTDDAAPCPFPFRVESEAVFLAALRRNPQNHVARYHYGNLLASLERWDEAVAAWLHVKGPCRAAARRNIGVYWWDVRNAPCQALRWYAEATKAPRCGLMALWEYDHLLEDLGEARKRVEVLRAHEEIVREDRRLLLRLAVAHADAGDLDRAEQILLSRRFPLCEGRMLPRLTLEAICRRGGEQALAAGDLAKALDYFTRPLDYAENLGSGKPAGNMEAEWWFRAAQVHQTLGDAAKAEEFLRHGAQPNTVLNIRFLPLRCFVPEQAEDAIDLYAWRNLAFRARCCHALGRIRDRDDIIGRLEAFVRAKSAEGRDDRPDVAELHDLLHDLAALCSQPDVLLLSAASPTLEANKELSHA